MYRDFTERDLSRGLAGSIFPPNTVRHFKHALAVIGGSLIAGLVAMALLSLVAPGAFAAPPDAAKAERMEALPRKLERRVPTDPALDWSGTPA